ncbi:MAG: hypothetical protein EBY63_02205 [Flavobacteriia bacterium]|nr:hypothetical protein [Flavobacteriia bacterium]
MTAQVAEEASAADTTIVEIVEEAIPTEASLVVQSVKINNVLYDLNEGLISKEEAQAKMDSIISELYLTSASFFENYVPDTVEEALSWNDDFSAAYSGPDSAQYPQEHYDTTFEDFDFDFSAFFDDAPKPRSVSLASI